MSSRGAFASSERGWALVSVLWFLAMLSLMAAAIQALSLTSARHEHRTMLGIRMDGILDAGIMDALLAATAKDPAQRWRVDGTEYSFVFDGLNMVASVQDESGRLDINSVDVTTLTALLRQAGVREDQDVDATADSILNWRGPATLSTLHGATDEDYRDAGRLYRPRHGPFQSVDELQLVLGMTPALFAAMKPALTVYSKRPMADAKTAPPQVLSILYDADREQVAALLTARATPGQACLDPGLGAAGHIISISVRAVAEGRTFSRTEVIELTGNASRPYLVRGFS